MESFMTAWYSWGVFIGVFVAAACAIYVLFDSQELIVDTTMVRVLAVLGALLTLPSLVFRLLKANDLAAGLIPRYYINPQLEDNWFAILAWIALAGVVIAVLTTLYYAFSVRNEALVPYDIPHTVPMSAPPVSAAPPPPPAPRPPAATVQLDSEPAAVAWLVVRSGPRVGHQYPLSQQKANLIGRDPSRADIVIDDDTVSREHARVRYDNGQFVLHDMASTGGTFVNGNTVQRQLLYDNDRITLGRVELVYKRVA